MLFQQLQSLCLWSVLFSMYMGRVLYQLLQALKQKRYS